jgi:hypothetical protein
MAIELLKAELPESSYGEFVSETEPTKGVIELRYLCNMRGYSGWHWLLVRGRSFGARVGAVVRTAERV